MELFHRIDILKDTPQDARTTNVPASVYKRCPRCQKIIKQDKLAFLYTHKPNYMNTNYFCESCNKTFIIKN